MTRARALATVLATAAGGLAAPACVLGATATAASPAHAATAASPAHAITRDWEASGAAGQAQASALEAPGSHGSEVLEDLAVQAPIQCVDTPGQYLPLDTQVIGASIPIRAGGQFSWGTIRHGSGTVLSGKVTGGRVALTYRHVATTANKFDGGTEVCNTGTVHLTGVPGHRLKIADRVWTGTTAGNNLPVTLNVVAGGRALEEQPRPPGGDIPQASIAFGGYQSDCGNGPCSNDLCAYDTQVTMFVAPDGSFGNTDWVDGDQAEFTGRFIGAHTVTGTFSNGAEGCAQTSWSAGP